MSHEDLQHHSICTAPQDRPATEVEALKARVRELEALQDDHARIEAELRNTEARYRSLFDEAGISIWELDWSVAKTKIDALRKDGVVDLRGYLQDHRDVVEELIKGIDVIDFNQATVDVYRAPDRETLWQSLDDYSDNTIWDDLPLAIEAMSGGASRHVTECPEIALDGTEVFIRIVRWVPEGYQDTWERVIEVVEDITERNRAQNAQRKTLSHLDRAQKVAKMGHWEWGFDTKQSNPSQGVADILGVSVEELRISDEAYLSFVHPADRERMEVVFGDPDVFHEAYETEYRVIRPDGEERVLLEIGEPEFDATGKSIGMYGIVQDITERHRAQKAQYKTLKHLDRAQKVAKMGHWEWGLGSKQLSPSQGMADILGRSTDELRVSNEAYLSFVHPSDREQTEAVLGDPDILDEAYETEYRIIRPDGEERVLLEIGEPASDAAGKPIGMFGIVQDITERKQVEVELLSAQQRANAANEAKSTFLANMSHEIRTPLNGILGMAQILSSGELDDQQTEQIEAVLESGKSLLAVVNDVLDLSKIEAGHMEIAPGEGDLTHVMKCMRRLWNPLAAEKGLELAIDVDDAVPDLSMFDPLRVRQCVSNLLSNAIKFTEVGRVGVRVTAKTIENDRQLVTVRVSDTGIGMSKDVLEDVFVPFAQAERSTSRDFGGTGLGLSISRKLARLMGGDLVVTSKLGEGSVFSLTFRLDLVQYNAKEHVERARDTDENVQVSIGCSRLKVLVVDDQPLNLMIVRLFLEPYHVDVIEVGGGQAALDHLASEPFDLVLLDIHMPVVDGPETFRRIRASGEPWSDIPVVALTADAMSGDKENYLDLGMNGYVSKPIDKMELIGEINRVSGVVPGKSPTRDPEVGLGDGEIELHKEAASGQTVAVADITDLLEQMDQVAGG